MHRRGFWFLFIFLILGILAAAQLVWQPRDIRLDTGDDDPKNTSSAPQVVCSGDKVYAVWQVLASAIPDEKYQFSHWSGDFSVTDNPLLFIMDEDKHVTANFVRRIYAPMNVTGQKKLNRSLSQVEYINVLSWQPHPDNLNITKYGIYLVENGIWDPLVELNADVFNYWHRRVGKDKSYTYAIVAINDDGREGNPAYVTVQ
ncbi:MAG: hypothetical protein JXB23_14315 [Candidatus Aminicenantes bacterium]|nr:hypothetical protein [Candidatus Aminicenantes bacterium]